MIAARSVALALGTLALPVLLLFRVREAPLGAERYKAQAYRPGLSGVWGQNNFQMSENVRKSQKKFSGSKKNRPPGDPPGGPKSLLEAKKSLLETKVGESDAFLALHARF